MAYKFDKKIERKRVRDGDGWRMSYKLDVTVTDDTDPTFAPFIKSVKGYPVDTDTTIEMGASIVAKINTELAKRKITADALLVEEEALGGAILDKIDAYLTTNVGI
jgi:hypothetical protein